ncbi:TAF2 [Symbiodinium microadriaticum]|nr:TAF2 [Symbiodinium microadriaticum]CAE7940142.1 TAF2 [Symbiodinium sp. KB8]
MLCSQSRLSAYNACKRQGRDRGRLCACRGLVRQRIVAEVDFTCRELRGLTVFEFHERDVGENEGHEVLVHFPAHSGSCRARICCSHRSACPPKAEDETELKEHKVCSSWKSAADDCDTEPLASLAKIGAPSWTEVDSDENAVQVSGLEDLLSWRNEKNSVQVLALHLGGILDFASEDLDETLTSVEIAVQWVIEGQWLRPETCCNHFIRLPVHPRDAGGVSDGIGGSGEGETSADMDFFLAGHMRSCPSWFPTCEFKEKRGQPPCPMELHLSVRSRRSLQAVTSGRLVESVASKDDVTCFKYLEACPLAPHDVPLVVGPLAEEVYDKGRLMAPLGFQALLPQAARGAGATLRGVEEALGRALPLAACTSLFLPLPHLRPAAAPRLADAKSLGKAAASWDARPFGSSLPCFDIHGGIHFFDLSLLTSSCPTLCSAVLRPLQAYAFATAWFGISVRLEADEHAWLFHGLCRLLSDSSLMHTWPSGLAEAEIAAKLREEGQLWHAQVEAGRDEQPLAVANAVKEPTPFSPGSFAQLLGPVRELKAYLVCHELCRRLDWDNFHSRLAAIWGKTATRCLTTTQFLELVGGVDKDFASQWIYGLGCPVVRVGWFYNQALHRLELSASQLPLEPTPLQKPPPLSHLTRRAGKTGVGFGYLGHASTAAAAQVSSDPREAQKVPFKYWTGTLVLDIYGRGSQTPGRVEIELTSPDEVRTTSLLPPGVDQPALGRQEAELPSGLAFLVVGPQRTQWPLVRLEIAQPLEFWEGMLRSSAAPAAEADAAKAIGDLLEAGQLPTGAAMSTLLQALSIPLKDEGWHEITCVECALTLCRWASKLQKGSALRSSLFRPLHEFFKSSRAAWQADTGMARVRMQVARCLQGRTFRALELWRHCLPLELCYESSREDPLSIACLEIQRDVPHNSRSDVSGAIVKRLRLESALPSEGHHLAAAAIRILLALCARGQAEAAQPWDDFLVEVPSNQGPSPLREAYAKAWGVLGPAPSYLEAFAEAPSGGFRWSRAVRREACAATCQCGEAGEALEALSRVLDGDSSDAGGEQLQRAVWAGEAVLLRSPPGSQLTTSESASRQKWQKLRKQLMEDDRQLWPALLAALRPTLALCRREASQNSQKARRKAPAEGAFWTTPGLFADIEPSHPQHATIAALKTPPAKAARVGDHGEATRAVTL